MLTAMALDVSNNVIVTGSALTIKYDTNGTNSGRLRMRGLRWRLTAMSTSTSPDSHKTLA
jgi:hypothetical protein